MSKSKRSIEQRKRIVQALEEIRHYLSMADDALSDGNLDDAEGWIQSLVELTQAALAGRA